MAAPHRPHEERLTRSSVLVFALALALAGCRRSSASPAHHTLATRPSGPPPPDLVIYDGGLQNGWQDWGWTAKEMAPNSPARVHLGSYGGWILSKPGLSGEYGGVLFRVQEPPGDEFLQVHLISRGGKNLPEAKVTPQDKKDVGGGWSEVFIPMDELDPDQDPFDRVVIHAARSIADTPVAFDKISLTPLPPPPAVSSYNPAALSHVAVSLDCRAKATKISPLIYGVAYYAFNDEQKQMAQWKLGATVRRWGGNPTSTYNWEKSVWNTGNDWYFENHDVQSYNQFLRDDAAHGMKSALTVPIMGWVSKDGTSSSFPESIFGPQDSTDGWRKGAGNGKTKGGKLIPPGPQTQAYEQVTPEFVKRWVETIRKADAASGHRSVDMYILDNEPMIWGTTHRDAHPEPLSYDELVQRTIDFGTAIRQADPDAVIAGPAEWGWTGYLYSGKDMANGGVSARPDRRAHGDVPVIPYYLKALADYEKKTGIRVLDVLDLHAYPYGEGVGSEAADPKTAALRIRSTRMYWDPSYTDESWVKDKINLLPRMKGWIDENYPGRGMSIGEWNFGAEQHISGGLATAEALGRFAQYGLTSAYYWVYPAVGTPAAQAFHAYRDFDGKGGHFQDWYTPSTVGSSPSTSVFASRDDSGKHLVMVLLNLSPDAAVAADVDASSCGALATVQPYTYQAGAKGFEAGPASSAKGPTATQVLPPYSMTVLDTQLDGPTPVTH